ncbi:MAG: DUF2182 domain-containing protein [Alphaproteobacteria bacterium]
MLESVLKRDRVVVGVSLALLTALAWAYLVTLAVDPGGMDAGGDGLMGAAALKPWTAMDFWLMFVMWAVMMVGMMVPAAAPMILLFALVVRKGREQGHLMAPVGAFTGGYVVAWSAFSLAATVSQWGLEQLALLSSMMVSASPRLGGGILVIAGVYQMTPLKDVCLRHCRAPALFLSHRWRPGTAGALRMGVEHGAFCVGCCWVLMGLLFVGGVMNLLWIAGIAALVLVEKVAPQGHVVGRLAGLAFMVWGTVVLWQAAG